MIFLSNAVFFTSDGADYNQIVWNITVISGVGVGHDITIPIPITNDNIAEKNEKFIVALSLISPSFNVRVDPRLAIVNITDDDSKYWFIQVTSLCVCVCTCVQSCTYNYVY